ncbi:YqzL family protein [Paenibacillus tarimensis]
MRNFSWNYFAMTGDVDAFLLYKEVDQHTRTEAAESSGSVPEMENEAEIVGEEV